ncbi:sensor histidine kinase [Paenibacillus rigui]|uniref:Two-component sensor histidine kinase n=1 Tax=Paenibacillus rigui TaxID=554312 RepID=A0A229UUW8_9BACL|nr:sensor histidine kinase [Paenibacillus rigui]OXM86955.1 two-component sensor histidine kinase [Paenibacillus rigui]
MMEKTSKYGGNYMTSFLSRSPIRIKLLIYFVPILVSSVVLTGLFSYLSAVKQLEKNAYYLLNDTVEQTGTFLEDKFLTIFEQLVLIENNNSFRNILGNTSQAVDQQRYDDIINLQKQFEESYQNHFQMIDSIFVTFNNGRSFNLQKDFVPRHVGINLKEWIAYYARSGNTTGYYWLNQHVDHVFETVETRRVVSLFKIIGNPQSEVNGVALINMRESYILNILRNVKVSPNGVLALISPDGVMYSKPLAGEYAISDSIIHNIQQSAEAQGSLQEYSTDNKPMMIRYTTLSLNQWKLAAIVPESDILSNASQIKSITFSIVLLILVVFSVVATLFASSLTNPIRFLSKQVKSVIQGNLNVSFRLKEQNEIGVLANGLESLVDSVQQLLQKVKDEQEHKRQIELLALQSQIQPHFLYNTMGSIKHLIDLGEKEKASTMVSALTHFFRIGISKGREVISIQEELEHVRNYLLIQNIRYSKDFEFEIEVEESILHLPIMKLTLQPIVENAIYHGIKNKAGRGIIRITGARQGDVALLQVFDDGAGMDGERLQQITDSIQSPTVKGVPVTFGLRNVHLRLALQFGCSYGLELESQEGEYTIVKVSIPYTSRGTHDHV